MKKDVPSIDLFLDNLKKEFEDTDAREFQMQTPFRQLSGWSSLQALVVVISFEEAYGITMSAEDLQHAITLADLHQYIAKKMGA